MTNAIILGAGMVGSAMADDLVRDNDFRVTIADYSEANLAKAKARAKANSGVEITTVQADLSDQGVLALLIEPYDIVLGALASHLGYDALRTVIAAGKNYADISFMPENALDHDALAKQHGVTAVVDCGVAPGMSNLLAGHSAHVLDNPTNIEIYVGGLPRTRSWPFEYKAGFAPADVIEEYTRPARYIQDSKLVTFEALTEPELMDLPGLGTLEAVNTDGLRSLADTLSIPNMKEKTLRYPGHYELMRVFRDTGLFSKTPINVKGQQVIPLDVLSALMFPKWTYEEGEQDLTIMRITVDGDADGTPTRHTWDILDYYDPDSGFSSMSRTTAYPCTIIARLLAAGLLDKPGVNPPELLADDKALVDDVLASLAARDIRYEFSSQTV